MRGRLHIPTYLYAYIYISIFIYIYTSSSSVQKYAKYLNFPNIGNLFNVYFIWRFKENFATLARMKIKDIWAFINAPHGWNEQELAHLTQMYNSLVNQLRLPEANKQYLRVDKICATCHGTATDNANKHIQTMKNWIRAIQKT